MDLNTFEPTFLIQIEGQALSTDITGEITSFVFEDNEEELDVMELSVSNRHLRFVDDPLFQEGVGGFALPEPTGSGTPEPPRFLSPLRDLQLRTGQFRRSATSSESAGSATPR